MDDIVNIFDILKKDKDKIPILLGNGFSINLSGNFSYKKLIEEIKKICSPELLNLIKNSPSKNTEDILLKLQNYIEVSKIISNDYSRVEILLNELKKDFIKVITDIHPKQEKYSFEDVEIRDELDLFGNIYTTNYDLSIYYLLVKLNSFTDKFGKGGYEELTFHYDNHTSYKKVNLYLHGSLMLFRTDDGDTMKLKSIGGKTLLEQVSEKVVRGSYPIIVTEGTSDYKLNKIKSNNYLTYCWDRFKEEKSDVLIIYGHSLNVSDEHIIELIKENFSKVYFGLHKIDEGVKHRIKSILNGVDVKFFNSNELFDTLPF